MGTLFEQKSREWESNSEENLDYNIVYLQSKAKEFNLSYAEVLETFRLLELRRKNDLYVMNGDIHDEQMAGLGSLLANIQESFERLNETLRLHFGD